MTNNFAPMLAVDLSSFLMPALLVILLVVMYFFGIRPQKKKEKEDNAMRNALAVGIHADVVP